MLYLVAEGGEMNPSNQTEHYLIGLGVTSVVAKPTVVNTPQQCTQMKGEPDLSS